jgi:hypothetical protein
MAERLLPLPDMHVAWVRSPVPARLMISVEKCFQGLWQTALLSAEGILALECNLCFAAAHYSVNPRAVATAIFAGNNGCNTVSDSYRRLAMFSAENLSERQLLLFYC